MSISKVALRSSVASAVCLFRGNTLCTNSKWCIRSISIATSARKKLPVNKLTIFSCLLVNSETVNNIPPPPLKVTIKRYKVTQFTQICVNRSRQLRDFLINFRKPLTSKCREHDGELYCLRCYDSMESAICSACR